MGEIPNEPPPPPYSKTDPNAPKKGMGKFKKFGIGALVVGGLFMLAPKILGSFGQPGATGTTNYYG